MLASIPLNCTSNADCTPLLTLFGWCASGAQCYTSTGVCIVWPTCRTAPYYGCVPATQECAHVRLEEPQPQVTSYGVGMFFLLLLGMSTLLLGLAAVFILYWRPPAGLKDQTHYVPTALLPPPISLGAALPNTEFFPSSASNGTSKADPKETTGLAENYDLDATVF